MDPKVHAKVVAAVEAGRDAAASMRPLETAHADCELGQVFELGRGWTAGCATGFPGGETRVSRAQVTERVQGEVHGGDPIAALAWCNAWGYGASGYGVRRHNDVAAQSSVESGLRRAIQLIEENEPIEAYYALNNRSEAHVRGLGPAFFTKFLYFVHRGRHGSEPSSNPDHPVPLILDAIVARQMRVLGIPGAPRGNAGWRTPDYAFYLGFANAVTDGPPEKVEAELFWRGRNGD
jgi:hypothetical protein